MEVIRDKVPRARLLATVEPDRAEASDDELFRGANHRTEARRGKIRGFLAVFLLVVIGLFAGLFWLSWSPTEESAGLQRRLEVVRHRLAARSQFTTTPVSSLTKFDVSQLHVTSIVLGHPRMAMINGKALSEGESFVVHPQEHPAAVTLKVVRIAEGRIDLSDGSHDFTAHLLLAASAPPAAKP